MKKQKVCVVGGGLTGLVTAITLSKLNLSVDLFTDNKRWRSVKINRTTAISQNNFNFLKRMKIFNSEKTEFWPCKNMKLYTWDNNSKLNEILKITKVEDQKDQALYMVDNSMLLKKMTNYIKKNNFINFKTNKKISEIVDFNFLQGIKFKDRNYTKYNLIILCTGGFSDLEKKLFKNQFIYRSYNEISVTTILKHSSIKNNSAKQIFSDNEILALLPLSNTKTSIVFSIKKKILDNYKKNKNLFFRKKINFYTNNFLKNIKFISRIETKDLNFLIRKKYFNNRVLLFGDALHRVHPLAGQGFNMILRDLMSLEKILKNKIELGLDVGSSDNLLEFSNEVGPRNFVYSFGINFIKDFFSLKNKSLKEIRNQIVKEINKNAYTKNIFYNIADKGFKF